MQETKTILIPMSQGKTATISAGDFGRVGFHKWYSVKSGDNRYYAATYIKIEGEWTTILMHRLIMDIQNISFPLVDHVNQDGLDNRRSNLRLCTYAENMRNRSRRRNSTCKYKGVVYHKHKKTRPYEASLVYGGKRKSLGCFSSQKMAALVYNVEAIINFGEFARLNEV